MVKEGNAQDFAPFILLVLTLIWLKYLQHLDGNLGNVRNAETNSVLGALPSAGRGKQTVCVSTSFQCQRKERKNELGTSLLLDRFLSFSSCETTFFALWRNKMNKKDIKTVTHNYMYHEFKFHDCDEPVSV